MLKVKENPVFYCGKQHFWLLEGIGLKMCSTQNNLISIICPGAQWRQLCPFAKQQCSVLLLQAAYNWSDFALYIVNCCGVL